MEGDPSMWEPSDIVSIDTFFLVSHALSNQIKLKNLWVLEKEKNHTLQDSES